MEHVFHVIRRDERIIDGNDLHIRKTLCRSQHKTTNAAETVDSDTNGHSELMNERSGLTVINCNIAKVKVQLHNASRSITDE